MRFARALPLAAGTAAVLLAGGTARAQDPTNGPGWAFGSWGGEIAVATVSLGAFLAGWATPQRRRLTAARWIDFGLTEVAAMATGTLRVAAGAHSPSDVAAGWAIGHLTGVGVALAHPMVRQVGPGYVSVGPGSLRWSGAF